MSVPDKKSVLLRFTQQQYDYIQHEAQRYELSIPEFLKKRIFIVKSDLDRYLDQQSRSDNS